MVRALRPFLPDKVSPYPPEQVPLAKAPRGESVINARLFLRPSAHTDGLWLDVSARTDARRADS